MMVAAIACTAEVRSQPPVIHAFPETGYESRVWGVSGNGSAAFGTFTQLDSSVTKPFRWSLESGVTYLEAVEGYPSAQPWKANFDGSVVVGRVYDESYETYRAVKWTASGVQELGLLSPTDTNSAAWGVSADGQVIVGQSEDSSEGARSRAFRWTAGDGMEDLGFLNSEDYVTARSTSSDGSVVVGWSGNTAFRWTADQGMVGLPGPALASAVSADGAYAVGYFGVVRWNRIGDLDQLGSGSSIPNSISADGSTIVGYDLSRSKAFMWTQESSFVFLQDRLVALGTNLEGWSNLSAAYDVSADGSTIVGVGTYYGSPRGFIVTAVPEPSTYAMALAGLACGCFSLRRRRKRA